jgi:hypothetical protein
MKPFRSPQLLLDRAALHIGEFEISEERFVKKHPYRQFQEIDTETRIILFKAQITEELPEKLPVVLFEAVNCMRSALDHAVFDCSILLGGKPVPKYTKFPFGGTEAQAKADLERKTSDVPENIRPFLLGFKPFDPSNGGNELLFGMNDLRNGKIHRTLTEMALANQSMGIGAGYIRDLAIEQVISEWDAEKKELTYMRALKADMSVNIRITIAVTFADGTPFARQPAVPVLKKCFDMVTSITSAIEAETARLRGN